MVVKICFYLHTLGKIQEYVTQFSFAFSVVFELYKMLETIDYTLAITRKQNTYMVKWIIWCNCDFYEE